MDPNQQQVYYYPPPQAPRSNNMMILVIIFIFLIMVAIGGGAYYYFYYYKKKDTTTTPPEQQGGGGSGGSGGSGKSPIYIASSARNSYYLGSDGTTVSMMDGSNATAIQWTYDGNSVTHTSSGKCLDPSNITKLGSNCTGSWTIPASSNFLSSGNNCMKIDGGSIANGSTIIMSPDCKTVTPSTQWSSASNATNNNIPASLADHTYTIYHPQSKKCLRSPGYGQIFNCEGIPIEKWKIINNGDDTYKLQVGTQCIGEGGSYITNCSGDPNNDNWKIIDGNGFVRFQSTTSNNCLRSPAGAYLQMFGCDGSDPEKWKLQA